MLLLESGTNIAAHTRQARGGRRSDGNAALDCETRFAATRVPSLHLKLGPLLATVRRRALGVGAFRAGSPVAPLMMPRFGPAEKENVGSRGRMFRAQVRTPSSICAGDAGAHFTVAAIPLTDLRICTDDVASVATDARSCEERFPHFSERMVPTQPAASPRREPECNRSRAADRERQDGLRRVRRSAEVGVSPALNAIARLRA